MITVNYEVNALAKALSATWASFCTDLHDFGLLKWEIEDPSTSVNFLDLILTLVNGAIKTRTLPKRIEPLPPSYPSVSPSPRVHQGHHLRSHRPVFGPQYPSQGLRTLGPFWHSFLRVSRSGDDEQNRRGNASTFFRRSRFRIFFATATAAVFTRLRGTGTRFCFCSRVASVSSQRILRSAILLDSRRQGKIEA